jgi:radical SAM superfamily enzyme YgiQ (UPF0313 family)
MHPPLYLLGAATHLRDRGGHPVLFVDAQAPGTTVAEFLRKGEEYRPDVAVLETCLPSFRNDLDVARRLKEATGCRIVLCGPQVGDRSVAREMIGHAGIDALVLGEYEESLRELVASDFSPGTPGTAVRDRSGEAVFGPPRAPAEELDSLADPDQRWLDHDAYFDPLLRNPFAFFLSGRGCPHGCSFCSWPQTFTGRRYRVRSPLRVADEVSRTLAANPRLRSFLFNDDTFTADRRHCMDVAAALKGRGVSLPWGCYTRADFDDDEVLRSLRSAGCFLLKVGVESSSADVLRRAGKGYDIDRVGGAVERMRRLGFKVHGTFAFGLPGETADTVRETIEWARSVDFHTVQFSVAVPYPGTAFHARLEEDGHLRPHAWEELTPLTPVYEYPSLSRGELSRAVTDAYRAFYLRPAPALRLLWRFSKEMGRMPGLPSHLASFLSGAARPRPAVK